MMSSRVLIVDDEDSICRMLATVFQRRGYEVVTAASGSDGLEQTAEQEPDLVLLDVNLGDGSGLDVLSDLRTHHPSLPVIMLTGSGADPALEQEALDKGAIAYLSKTAPLNQLFTVVERALA